MGQGSGHVLEAGAPAAVLTEFKPTNVRPLHIRDARTTSGDAPQVTLRVVARPTGRRRLC
jgi:hypothetical protein